MRRWRKRKPQSFLGVRRWPVQTEQLTTEAVISLYSQGFSGTIYDPEEDEKLLFSQQWPDGEQAAYDFGLAGSGAGKLSLAFMPAWKRWPKVWPSPGQTTGSCVSKAGKNVGINLIGVEAELQTPDPVTGLIEDIPELTEQGISQGVIASEPIYGYRGHSGQGASCSRLIQYVMSAGGLLLRKNYPELGIDFTIANDSVGARWGGRGTPANINEEGKKHQIRAATDCANHEICRDFIHNGYTIWVCSGLGWSSKRDEYGYSRQQGGWSHSWVADGYDDRPETIRRYGFPLFHYNHDWGRWNSGGRDILNTEDLVAELSPETKSALVAAGIVNPQTNRYMIPEGSFWADARLLNRCDCTAMSNLNGWPRRQIDNLLI